MVALFRTSKAPGAVPISAAPSASGATAQHASETSLKQNRQDVGSEVGPVSEESTQAAPESLSEPDPIKKGLACSATDALYGRMDVNAVLRHALALAELPVKPSPDLDYEDNDSIAFQFEGMPEGMEAHMLTGLQSYVENGRDYRYIQMDINIPGLEPEYLDGAMREGPNINFSISYDVLDPKTPVRFALMLQRGVDLSASRAKGIDAYSGVYTQGSYFWQDLLDPTKVSAKTFGIENGNPLGSKPFPNAVELVGDLTLDPVLLNEMLGKLQEKLSYVKGQ